MRNFFFPVADSTIYSEFPLQNAGFDEIISVGKTNSGEDIARAVLDFDFIALSQSVQLQQIPPNAEFDLRLYMANATNVSRMQSIIVCPLSQSWSEGQGYFYQNVVQETDGVSWTYRTSGSSWDITGSSYYASPTASAIMPIPLGDVVVNVTPLVQQFISGAFFDGILVKYPTEDESDTLNNGLLSFFSKDTHTVYSPVLVAKWDDSMYNTGSLASASMFSLSVHPRNLSPTYKVGEQTRIDLSVREQYPVKQFATQFTAFAGNQYLPSSSYYSIVDVQSQEVIIPFDTYSLISTDFNGSYFNLRIEKMFPRRFYKVMIKVVGSGYEYIFDNNYQFTISL